MKILVTAKRVPDPEQKVKLKGNELDQSATNWQLNQFDEYAVETALRLTENASAGNARDGEVIVVSIGPKDVQQQLRSTLAMGADKAILVDGEDDELDAEIVARTVQKLAEREKPDLDPHGQAGRRRRGQRRRAAAGRLPRLAAGDLRRHHRGRRRRQGAARRPRGRRRPRDQEGDAAGGGHGRPAHRRAARHQERQDRQATTPTPRGRATRRSRASWRRRRSRSKRPRCRRSASPAQRRSR